MIWGQSYCQDEVFWSHRYISDFYFMLKQVLHILLCWSCYKTAKKSFTLIYILNFYFRRDISPWPFFQKVHLLLQRCKCCSSECDISVFYSQGKVSPRVLWSSSRLIFPQMFWLRMSDETLDLNYRVCEGGQRCIQWSK